MSKFVVLLEQVLNESPTTYERLVSNAIESKKSNPSAPDSEHMKHVAGADKDHKDLVAAHLKGDKAVVKGKINMISGKGRVWSDHAEKLRGILGV